MHTASIAHPSADLPAIFTGLALRFARWAAIVLVFMGIFLPWIMSGATALNHNAIDLAEWASIHPLAAAQTPPYGVALMLRLPLVLLGLCIGWMGTGAGRFLRVVALLWVVLFLLPPFEFVADSGNANYRQQATLALMTLIAGGAGITFNRKQRLRTAVTLVCSLVGCIVPAFAAASVLPLREAYLPTSVGTGVWLTTGGFVALTCLVGVSAWSAWMTWSTQQKRQT